MSRLFCTCGHTITDITDYLPYKAYYTPDEDMEQALHDAEEKYRATVEARERGEVRVFIHPVFTVARVMYECEACGRLWLQTERHTNEFVPYQPESAKRGILSHKGVPENK